MIAIKILQVIEGITGAATVEQFDILAGTSTGGLIAAALATAGDGEGAAYSLEQIESMYLEVGQQLFVQGGLAYNGEEVKKFEKLLKDTFGKKRLSDSLKPLFIPTYDTTENKLVVFKTRSARQDISKDITIFQACRATTAIEPVFPPYIMSYHGRQLRCVDAGYKLKNPALSALAEVWKHRDYYKNSKLREENIILLSVSTGSSGKGADWTTDISQVLHSQRTDMEYIKSQNLDIDFSRIKFMRVDLDLGGSAFSLMQLLNWLAKIESLAEDRRFRQKIYSLLVREHVE